MIIYVNERNEIKDVETTNLDGLTAVEVTDGTFDGWSKAKICCYRAVVDSGNVTMLTPYIDSRLIEHIDQLGRQTEAVTPKTFTKTAYIDDTEVVFANVPKGNLSVYADNLAYRIERTADMVRISFEALSEPKKITISIL